jgi:hypothetical protein
MAVTFAGERPGWPGAGRSTTGRGAGEESPLEGGAHERGSHAFCVAGGKQLLTATYDLLRHDKQMFALPFIGSVFGIVACLALFAPGYALGWVVNGHEKGQLAYYTGIALGGFGATVVAIFFQTALVIGANERAEGGQPTTRSCLRRAWTRRRMILGWSLISATIGFVLQLIHNKLGFLGSLLNLFGGLAWSIATYVVVPVFVSEDVGPVTAIRRSTQVLRKTWGASLRTALRGAVLTVGFWIPFAALVAVGGTMICLGGPSFIVVGIVFAAIGVVGLVVLSSIVGAVGNVRSRAHLPIFRRTPHARHRHTAAGRGIHLQGGRRAVARLRPRSRSVQLTLRRRPSGHPQRWHRGGLVRFALVSKLFHTVLAEPARTRQESRSETTRRQRIQ